MKPEWLIQQTKAEPQTALAIELAAQELGLKTHLREMFQLGEPDFSGLPRDCPVIFFGPIFTVRFAQQNNAPFNPFAWFDFHKLSCQSYYAHWGQFLATPAYGFYPLGELRRLKDWLYQTYSQDHCIFIRPDANDKFFTGEVVELERFDNWMNWDWTEKNNADVLVVVATPVDIDREWRLFLANNKVVTGSQYKEKRALYVDAHVPEGVINFAEEVASAWSPHSVYCLDIGLTARGYRVIECGSANCAGFYKSDVRAVVKAMSEAAEAEYAARGPKTS